MARFGRVLTAMVTPFDTAGQVDYQRAAELALWLVSQGSDGLVVAGTTGEAPTLSADEKLQLFQTVRETVGDTATVVAGTSTNNTAESIELTRAVAEVGLDGVMLTGPYYNKPSQEGFYQHFKAIAQATELPVILYNVPGRTSKNIEAPVVLRLAEELANVVAIKEASGDLEQITAICAGAPAGFEVYSGEDSLTLPMMAVGCAGVISVASHVAGPSIAEMLAAFVAGDNPRAARLQQRLLPVFKACFLASGNPACVKAGLSLVGQPCGPVRLPLVSASEADRQAMREALQQEGSAQLI